MRNVSTYAALAATLATLAASDARGQSLPAAGREATIRLAEAADSQDAGATKAAVPASGTPADATSGAAKGTSSGPAKGTATGAVGDATKSAKSSPADAAASATSGPPGKDAAGPATAPGTAAGAAAGTAPAAAKSASPADADSQSAVQNDPLAEQPDDPEQEEFAARAQRLRQTMPPWRMTIALGGAQTNGKPFRGLLQNGSMDSEALDVDWQPGPFGLRLGVGFLSSNEAHERIASRYESTEYRLAATYVAPLAWQDLQVVAFAGAFAAAHHIDLNDGSVDMSSSSSDDGPFVGVDLATPPLGGLRFLLRLSVSEQKVNFSQFGFQHYFVERSLLIGGSYAF